MQSENETFTSTETVSQEVLVAAQVAETTPIEASASVAETTPIEASASVAETTPTEASASVAETMPTEVPVPTAETTPAEAAPVADIPYKYTEIDCLDVDTPILGQSYVLLSFISPEGIMNCDIRGLKVRGTYPTYDMATKAAKKLRDTDKYHHVFIGEVGKWLPWDPSEKQVEEENYKDKDLNDIMKKAHETEMRAKQQRKLDDLNELAGRHRENIDKGTQEYNKRKNDMIKEGAAKMETRTTQQTPKKVKHNNNNATATNDPSHRQNRDDIRARLRDKLDKARQEQQQASQPQVTPEESSESIMQKMRDALANAKK